MEVMEEVVRGRDVEVVEEVEEMEVEVEEVL